MIMNVPNTQTKVRPVGWLGLAQPQQSQPLWSGPRLGLINHSAWACGHHDCATYLRKWAGRLYKKLSFKDRVKLRLDSTGVTKRSVNRTTGKTVVSDTEFASFWYLKVIGV